MDILSIQGRGVYRSKLVLRLSLCLKDFPLSDVSDVLLLARFFYKSFLNFHLFAVGIRSGLTNVVSCLEVAWTLCVWRLL